MALTIQLFPALNGDCILIQYGEETGQEATILVDGGYGKSCKRRLHQLAEEYKENKKQIDLLVVTHLDSDHITGIYELLSWEQFEPTIIKKIWFNIKPEQQSKVEEGLLLQNQSTKISMEQGIQLDTLIKGHRIPHDSKILAGHKESIGGATIKVLNPDAKMWQEFYDNPICDTKKETKIASSNDYNEPIGKLEGLPFEGFVTVSNRSSIAFLMQYQMQNFLFLGDASADQVVEGLHKLGYSKENKLDVLCCKVAHHASKHNTSNDLLEIINCQDYLISTNVTSSGRPSKECLSRIVLLSSKPVRFYCNYDMTKQGIFTKEEMDAYSIHFITQEKISMEDLLNGKESTE